MLMYVCLFVVWGWINVFVEIVGVFMPLILYVSDVDFDVDILWLMLMLKVMFKHCFNINTC